MNRFFNKKIIFSVIGIVIVLLAVVIWWLWNRHVNNPLNPAKVDKVTVQNPIVVPTSTPVIEYHPGDEVVVVARNVVERYGSYSNQTPGQNIRDIAPMITASLRQKLESQSVIGADAYQGVDTKVLVSKVIEQSSQSATVQVSTQRVERSADLSTQTRYQDAEVILIKNGDGWLVNSIDWKS